MRKFFFFGLFLTLLYSTSVVCWADGIFSTVTPFSQVSGNPISTGYFPNTTLNQNQNYYQAQVQNPYYDQYQSPYQNNYNNYSNYNNNNNNSYYRRPPIYGAYGYQNPYLYPNYATSVNNGIKTQVVRNIGQNLIYSMMNR